MAVLCPGCGRGYDVTLFPFGRTIRCTCGSKVGMAPADRPMPKGADIRFLADAMLGRLAAWLRILGFDAALAYAMTDQDVVRRAFREGRVILTRDRRLSEDWRIAGLYLVRDAQPTTQLQHVVQQFDLAQHVRLFTRCSRCNALLEPKSRAEVESLVPPRARAQHASYAQCPGCRRVYWHGAHTRRMVATLREALHPLGWSGP